MKSQIVDKFSDFYEKWINKHEEYHQLLLGINKDNNTPHHEPYYEALVNKLTAHHKEYYTVKWAAAHEDVLAFYTPVWLTPLENAYLWLTDWKPSMAFRLLDSLKTTQLPNLGDMSEEQLKNIEALKTKIKAEEEKVERKMTRQQMAMADRNMVELAKITTTTTTRGNVGGGGGGGEGAAMLSRVDGFVGAALRNIMAGLEEIMKMADCVRLKTLKGILDILNLTQRVNFLAAASMVHTQMRKWGKRKEDKENK